MHASFHVSSPPAGAAYRCLRLRQPESNHLCCAGIEHAGHDLARHVICGPFVTRIAVGQHVGQEAEFVNIVWPIGRRQVAGGAASPAGTGLLTDPRRRLRIHVVDDLARRLGLWTHKRRRSADAPSIRGCSVDASLLLGCLSGAAAAGVRCAAQSHPARTVPARSLRLRRASGTGRRCLIVARR